MGRKKNKKIKVYKSNLIKKEKEIKQPEKLEVKKFKSRFAEYLKIKKPLKVVKKINIEGQEFYELEKHEGVAYSKNLFC